MNDFFPGIQDFFLVTPNQHPDTPPIDIDVRLRSTGGDPFVWIDFISEGKLVEQVCTDRELVCTCISANLESLLCPDSE